MSSIVVNVFDVTAKSFVAHRVLGVIALFATTHAVVGRVPFCVFNSIYAVVLIGTPGPFGAFEQGGKATAVVATVAGDGLEFFEAKRELMPPVTGPLLVTAEQRDEPRVALGAAAANRAPFLPGMMVFQVTCLFFGNRPAVCTLHLPETDKTGLTPLEWFLPSEFDNAPGTKDFPNKVGSSLPSRIAAGSRAIFGRPVRIALVGFSTDRTGQLLSSLAV